RRFQAATLADNAAMLEVFRDSGFQIRSKSAGGCVEVELSLQPSAASVAAVEERERIATTASIRPLLAPRSVAVIGASRERTGLGRRIFDAIRTAGFAGPVYAVNAAASDIDGQKIYASARELPPHTDLAVVAVPCDRVLDVVDD